jgi:hypothetical protein
MPDTDQVSSLTAGHITISTPESMETPRANPKDHKVITACISGKYCETKVGISISRSTPKASLSTLRTIVWTAHNSVSCLF